MKPLWAAPSSIVCLLRAKPFNVVISMEMYKKISRTIRLLYAACVAMTVLFVVFCESGQAPVEGALAGLDGNAMYLVEVITLVVVGVVIFASLRGYDWLLPRQLSKLEGDERTLFYVRINTLRIILLAMVMALGMFFKYSTLTNWGMYYALAALVVSLFCLPSVEQVEQELEGGEYGEYDAADVADEKDEAGVDATNND